MAEQIRSDGFLRSRIELGIGDDWREECGLYKQGDSGFVYFAPQYVYEQRKDREKILGITRAFVFDAEMLINEFGAGVALDATFYSSYADIPPLLGDDALKMLRNPVGNYDTTQCESSVLDQYLWNSVFVSCDIDDTEGDMIEKTECIPAEVET